MFIKKCWLWSCLTWKSTVSTNLSDECLAATLNNCDRWPHGCSSRRSRKWSWNQRPNTGSPCGKHWNGIGGRYARNGKALAVSRERCIWHKRSPIAGGTQEGFPGCRTPGEAAGGSGINSQLCARYRAAFVADGDTEKVPVDARSGTTAEPIGVSSGRGPH